MPTVQGLKEKKKTTKMQDADCSNVDEAGFPKDRLGHNAVARRNSFSICTTGEGNTCHRTRLLSKCSLKVGHNLASWCC